MRAALAAIAFFVVVLLGSSAEAQVRRFALLIGHNSGASDEPELEFAEEDARRVGDVLRELGGFPPEDMVTLLGEPADVVQRALIALNDRLRTEEGQSVLFVYYSGHGDARSLHLGDTRLPVRELRQLVRGSSATFRVLVVDSCRSGSVTRGKGGRNRAPFSIRIDPGLSGQGSVFLTSSALNEDAHESDELGGSFFTHYLVSALLGAGDENADGDVDIGEAYRYTYASTLRASSRALGTVQHPTFRYDYAGQRDIVLTRPGARDPRRGFLDVPTGRTYLVLRGDDDGPVVAEVGLHDSARRLNLRAGRYYVIARGRRHLLEGGIEVSAGQATSIEDERLERVEYARLVRRGGGDVSAVHGVQVGYRLRTPVVDGASLCHGFAVGYSLDLAELSIGARLSGCRGSFENADLRADTDELGLELRGVRVFDLSAFSVELGVLLGAAYLRETFETRGRAPTREALAGELGVTAAISRELALGFFTALELSAATYFFRTDERGDVQLQARFALMGALALGKRF